MSERIPGLCKPDSEKKLMVTIGLPDRSMTIEMPYCEEHHSRVVYAMEAMRDDLRGRCTNSRLPLRAMVEQHETDQRALAGLARELAEIITDKKPLEVPDEE